MRSSKHANTIPGFVRDSLEGIVRDGLVELRRLALRFPRLCGSRALSRGCSSAVPSRCGKARTSRLVGGLAQPLRSRRWYAVPSGSYATASRA